MAGKSNLHQLSDLGQSVWIDYLSRTMLHEGESTHGVTVEQILAEHRVALAPGEGFGARGAGWARLSLAVTDETLELGLERLRPLLSAAR